MKNNDISYQSKLRETVTTKQKTVLGMLSVGTLLECMDLMLYTHMSVMISKVFFPPDSSNNWFFKNFALCSTYLFRPLGGVILGYIGDKLGRRAVIFVTTTATAIGCMIVALLPGYSSIGLLATYTLLVCRILQGITSMGELHGAKLYMIESTKGIRVQCFFGSMFTVLAETGGLLSVAIAAICINLNEIFENAWRSAFVIGSLVGVLATYARSKLKETPEYTKSREELSDKKLQNEKVNPWVLFFFIVNRVSSVSSYWTVPFVVCVSYLSEMGISEGEIATQSLYITLLFVANLFVYSLLVRKIDPIKLSLFRNWCYLIYVPLLPILLSKAMTPFSIGIIQCLSLMFTVEDFPASAVFCRQFPILKRTRCVMMSIAFGSSFAAILAIFLSKYGSILIWLVLLPLIITSLIGKYYIRGLARKQGLAE